VAGVPLDGHPSVRTAFAPANPGEIGPIDGPITITLEEKAGLVPVSIHKRHGHLLWFELSAPGRLTLGKTIATQTLAAAVSLTPDDIVTRTHLPQVASVGLTF